MMTTKTLEFRENGLSVSITIPPMAKSIPATSTILNVSHQEQKTQSRNICEEVEVVVSSAAATGEGNNDLSSSSLPFVLKLHEMLDYAEISGQDDIISWVDNGRAFKVYRPVAFLKDVIPRYSKLSKFKSFQRQLHLYGFNSYRGAYYYYHPKFIRGKKALCMSMTPKKKNLPRRRSSQSSSGSGSSQGSLIGDNAKLASIELNESSKINHYHPRHSSSNDRRENLESTTGQVQSMNLLKEQRKYGSSVWHAIGNIETSATTTKCHGMEGMFVI